MILVINNNLLFLFLVFYSSLLFSQGDTIYVDENDQYISKWAYYNKAKSDLFKGKRYATDTLVIETLELKCVFGKLKPLVKSQLFKSFNSRNQIDTSKVMIIHYGDTLRSTSEYSKKKNESEYMFSFEHEHHRTYKGFVYGHKKCAKDHKKYKDLAAVLHFYDINNGHPKVKDKLIWYQDYDRLIKRIFFNENWENSRNMILRPNGEYYIGNCFDYRYYADKYDEMIKGNEWDEYRRSFERKVKALNQYKELE